MEYLQYKNMGMEVPFQKEVLNLVINGIPSILGVGVGIVVGGYSFKPCYKWNTFNTG